jgi:hypothetical protein
MLLNNRIVLGLYKSAIKLQSVPHFSIIVVCVDGRIDMQQSERF